MPLNLPNQITLARFVLACIFFALLTFTPAVYLDGARIWLSAAFWVFLVAVVSDAIDGHIARTLGQVSTFGRIVDPVVDKVLICGAFAFLAGPKFHAADGSSLSGIAPWIVVLILGRELLISAFRAQSEAAGRDFSAVWSGKLKMIVQSTTVCVIVGRLAFYPEHAGLLLFSTVLIWLTVAVTIWSLFTYVRRAWPLESHPGRSSHPPASPEIDTEDISRPRNPITTKNPSNTAQGEPPAACPVTRIANRTAPGATA